MEIKVETRDKKMILTYSDNGKGMSQPIMEKAFEPFFTTKRGAGGSGLGLHMVYNYVTQLLGGTIQLSSESGKGIQFTISIPINSSDNH